MKKGSGFKQDKKFSVLKLDPEDKKALEKISSEIGISMTQMIVFAAIRATQLGITPKPTLDDSIQIRLTESLHAQLEQLSEETNRPMTELITIGLETAFKIELKKV